jgi:uncharacterized protein with GYD domain
MPKFLVSVSYSHDGAKGLRAEGGTKREHVVKSSLESLGGKLEVMYFTFGEHDAIVIADLPDNVAVAALSLAVAATGAAKCTTSPLLSPPDMDKAVGKSTAYRAPGA